MATIHTQRIDFDWGTDLWAAGPDNSYVGNDYMRLNTDNHRRPLMRFKNDAFSGQIQSATLNVYVRYTPSASWILGRRVNRNTTSAATWNNCGYGAWDVAGCNGAADRSSVDIFNINTTLVQGWNAINLTNLSEVQLMLDEYRTLTFYYTSPTYLFDHVFEKSNSSNYPYLSINYTSSLVGGVQIF
jgi:hypothetical protein